MHRLLMLSLTTAIFMAACSSSAPDLAPAPTPAVPDDVVAADEPEAPDEPTATPAPTPTPEPTPVPGELTVDDPDVVGSAGDGRLSLAEAVALANGRLEVASLDEAERGLVTGQPGAGVPDTIVVAVEGGRLLAPGGDFFLVEMFGNDGDVIDGGGTEILASAPDGESRNVMLVGSSDIVIRGFEFVGVEAAIAVESVGQERQGVRIEANSFTGTVFDDIVVRSSLPGGAFTDLAIVDNSFSAPESRSDQHRFVNVFGGVASADSEAMQGAEITGLEISGNTMTSAPGATAACVSISGGVVERRTEGSVSNITVRDTTIAGNTMTGCDTAIELTGGAALQQRGTVSANTVAGVVIVDNALSGLDRGIVVRGGHTALVASFADPPDSVDVIGNSVAGVEIVETTFADVGVAIELIGGDAELEAAGSVSANLVEAITTLRLTFTDAATACVIEADRGDAAETNDVAADCAEIAPPAG